MDLLVISYHTAILRTQGAGRVRAVFDRAWHLEDAADAVVTIVTAPYDGPMAVRVGGVSLAPLGIRPGAPVRFDPDALAVDGLRLPLAAAVPWSPDRAAWRRPLDPSVLPGELPVLIGRLRTAGRGGLMPVLPGEPATGGPEDRHLVALRRLPAALRFGDAVAVDGHVRGLLGLGPGLTPAGDDVLCGLLVGLRVLARRLGKPHPGIAGALPVLIDAVQRAAPGRTTALSRTLLWQACRGVAPQPVLDVLCTLGSGKTCGLDALLAIGHSSGSDLLTGVCLAVMSVLEGEDGVDPSLACPA